MGWVRGYFFLLAWDFVVGRSDAWCGEARRSEV